MKTLMDLVKEHDRTERKLTDLRLQIQDSLAGRPMGAVLTVPKLRKPVTLSAETREKMRKAAKARWAAARAAAKSTKK